VVLAAAQTVPGPDGRGTDFVGSPDFLKLWRQANSARQQLYFSGTQQADKPCSIPLTNVTPKVPSRMPVIKPDMSKTVEMPKVEMPAPPCEEPRK